MMRNFFDVENMNSSAPATFLVVGMHKSGTTLVAEILHRSGILMEDGLARPGGYDRGEKMERARAQAINKTYLACGDVNSLEILPETDRCDPVRHAACLVEARAMISDLSQPSAPPWGFKDPRTLLALPLWLEAFEAAQTAPRLIGIYRHPVEVFGHYKRLLGRRWLHRDPGYLLRVLHSWCVHNRVMCDLAKTHTNMLLLEFTSLMTDESEIRRLSHAIAAPLEDMRQARMYRARGRADRDYLFARTVLRLQGKGDPEQLMGELDALRAAQIASGPSA
jgi:hypothetical protein